MLVKGYSERQKTRDFEEVTRMTKKTIISFLLFQPVQIVECTKIK